jgi:hypothetical protein
MNFETFMKTVLYAQLTNGNKWLVWDDENNEWIVYERRYRQKTNTVHYNGQNLNKAIEILGRED